jgi:diguanylate cyclase (GGDEF)-like protein
MKDGLVAGFQAVARDITRRKRAEEVSQRLAAALAQSNERLKNLAVTDDLTGLYNRRGFNILAEHQLNLARRNKSTVLAVFIDLDGLKAINDTFGHVEGSRAIAKAAEILKKTFRKSDIIARFGGDEFAVLSIGISTTGAIALKARLEEKLARHNAQDSRRYLLSMSMGFKVFDRRNQLSIEEMLAEADEAMYENKQAKKAS